MTDDRKSIVDYILAAQIERGDDIITAKPKTTIADLLALHDLDLGALAHKVGVTGDGFTTAHSLLLLGSYTRCDDDCLTMATDAAYAMDGGWMECARRLGALGAKVRAAAEGLTEAECRHLSGLSAADALAWCQNREAAKTTDAPEKSPRWWHMYGSDGWSIETCGASVRLRWDNGTVVMLPELESLRRA